MAANPWAVVGVDDADPWAVVPERKVGLVEGALAQFNQGLSLGGSDEIVAGYENLTGGDYAESMARQKAEREAFQAQHPYLSAVATAGGAVAPVVASTIAGTVFGTPAGGVAAGTATGGRALQLTRQALGIEGAGAVGRANTVRQAAVEGAKAAATPATVAGYLTANPGERGMGAMTGLGSGVALGGTLGAGTQLAQNWGGRAVPYLQRVANALGVRAGPPGSFAQPPRTGGGNVTPITRDEAIILQRMEEGGVEPEMAAEMLSRARKAGVPLALVDVGGQPVQRLARGTRALPGEASAIIDTALSERAAAQPGRVISHVERGVGRKAGGNAGEVADDLLRAARAESGPLYKKVDALPPIKDANMAELFQIPAVRNIMQRSEANAAKFGRPVNPLFDADGNLLRDPTFADVNRVKQSLDELLSPTYNMGPRPADALAFASREEQALARELRTRLVKLANKAPGGATYQAARESYATPARAREQYNEGLDFTRKNTSREDVRAQRREGSPADRKWYDRGVVEGIRAKVMGVGDLTGRPNVLRQFWDDPESRNKLLDVVSPRRQEMLTNRMMMENQAAQTNTFVRSGSQTADKTAEALDVAADLAGAVPSGPKAVAVAAAQKAWDRVRANANEATRARIARHLVNMDTDQQLVFLRRLADLQQRGKVNADQVAALANVITRQQSTQ